MAEAPSWIMAYPSVTDHPAAGNVPPAPAPSADPGWIQAYPSVQNFPAQTPLAAAPAALGHPVAGPTDPTTPWWQPSFTDIGRNIGTGLVNAMTGIVGALPIPENSPDLAKNVGIKPVTPQQMRNNAFNNLGLTEYQPQSWAGRRGQDLAGAIPASLTAGPEAIPSIAGGTLAAGTVNEAIPGNPLLAAIAGIAAGGGAAALANHATPPSLVPPAGGSLPIEDAQLAQRAQDFKIPISLPQLTRSWVVKNAADLGGKAPFSGSDAFADAQREAFTRAVSNTFGENASRITSEVLQSAKDRLSNGFNTIAQRTTIPANNQFLTDLQRVVDNARLTMSADSVAPVERQAMNILDTAANNNGNLGGRAYIDLTAKGGPLDMMSNSSDSGLRYAGGQLRNVLDSHFQQNAAPGDAAELSNLRSQWKAMRTVQPLTLRADTPGGATPSTGDISPAALRAAVNQSYTNAAFAPLGQIPLNDLAKIGQRFLKAPLSSGTAERNMLRDLLETGGTMGAGFLGGEHIGVAPMTAAGVLGGSILANRMLQGALRNQYLARQSIAASLNPNGFRFGMAPQVLTLPFSMGGNTSTSPQP